LLRWCLSNVTAKEDANGNVFPRKDHERLKIDPIVGVILAMGGWTQDGQKESIYESRPLRIL
jgi:phage terminase large subunit-like protein